MDSEIVLTDVDLDATKSLAYLIEENDRLEARVRELEEALTWYRDKAEGCRKVTSEGNDARRSLDKDGGDKARAALKEGM